MGGLTTGMETTLRTSRLGCDSAATLFYEPEGLLLRCCLIPKDPQHRQHLLTFQLGFLGPGEITVYVGLEGGPTGGESTVDGSGISTVVLSGVDGADEPVAGARPGIPSVRLSYVTVPDGEVDYRYTVWGQAGGPEDRLRGELSVAVSGRLPELTLVTRAGATRKAIFGAGPLPVDPYRVPEQGDRYLACVGRQQLTPVCEPTASAPFGSA